jgi:signal transduction histidine kinase
MIHSKRIVESREKHVKGVHMQLSKEEFNPSSNAHLLLAYVADLELEVDRLRKQEQFLRHEARDMLGRVQSICRSGALPESSTPPWQDRCHGSLMRCGTHEPPGYPAHDQVVAIAVRPLVEQVFRAQQRLLGVPHAQLRMELATEHVDWFPARLRHILDNLLSNALKYSDPAKGEARVFLGLNRLDERLELRVSDNGLGMPWDKRAEASSYFTGRPRLARRDWELAWPWSSSWWNRVAAS